MLRLTTNELELLLSLSHLRILSSDQIGSLFYPDRTARNVSRRLRRLRQVGVVGSRTFYGPQPRLAWHISSRGLRYLRTLAYQPADLTDRWYNRISPLFLHHLIDTNEVFAILALKLPMWSTLPFSWVGSHRYERRKRSIMAAAKNLSTSFELCCVHLAESEAVRALCSVDGDLQPCNLDALRSQPRHAEAPPPPAISPARHRAPSRFLPRGSRSSSAQRDYMSQARPITRKARTLLVRLAADLRLGACA